MRGAGPRAPGERDTKKNIGFADVELATADQKLIELKTIFTDAAKTYDWLDDIAECISTLQQCFRKLRISLQQTNKPFEGYDSFDRTLRACDLFIQSFGPRHDGQGWLYVEDDVTRLGRQLTMQITLISTSTIVLLAYGGLPVPI